MILLIPLKFMRNMRKHFYPLIIFSSFTLTACSTILENIPGIYTLDIQQGNIINQEMVDQLKPNMTKRQVLYIMGSSMLVDVFHQKRWDYLYSEQLDGEPRKQKRLSLYFEGDSLSNIQGDFRPSKKGASNKSEETIVDVPPRDLERTLWEKITGLFSEEDDRRIPQNNTEKFAIETKNMGTEDGL
jgi:outer membrane protein assembly factor BamE